MSISERTLTKLRENDKTLFDITASGSPIGDEGLKTLAAALERNTVLQSLELGNSNIEAEGVKALASALSKGIPLYHNPILKTY